MEQLYRKISSYLEYLITDLSLKVSVHFGKEILSCIPKQILSSFLKYNSHTNPYCISVKNSGNYEKCLMSQKELLADCKNGESFLRICHAGVCEYIHPVLKDNIPVGFVAVSGYRKTVHGISIPNKSLWAQSLNNEEIPIKFLDTVISPLCIMLENFIYNLNKEAEDEYSMLLQFLNEYHTSISLEDLCRHFGRSKSHISHLFKSSNGMTIRAYCNSLKLEDSKKLLCTTDLSITEIAFESGFSDVSYYISLFKKSFGLSPNQFRKHTIAHQVKL